VHKQVVTKSEVSSFQYNDCFICLLRPHSYTVYLPERSRRRLRQHQDHPTSVAQQEKWRDGVSTFMDANINYYFNTNY